MMTRQMIVVVGVFLLALAASSAQQRQHNMAIFDTLAGKTVIKLYSKGVLDTIIVWDRKSPAKNNSVQSRQEENKSSRERTTSPTVLKTPANPSSNSAQQQDDASADASTDHAADALHYWQ